MQSLKTTRLEENTLLPLYLPGTVLREARRQWLPWRRRDVGVKFALVDEHFSRQVRRTHYEIVSSLMTMTSYIEFRVP